MAKNIVYKLNIEGMDCTDCAMRIEREVGKLTGVKLAKVDFINSKLNVSFDETKSNLHDVKTAVRRAGYTVKQAEGIQRTTLIVKGMDCPDESRPIEDRLKKLDGVYNIQFNLVTNKLILEHKIPLKQIRQTLKELGFEAELADQAKSEVPQNYWLKHKMLILTIISGTFAIVGAIHNYIHTPDILTIPLLLVAIVSGGFHIAKKGLIEARSLRLGMNFLMSIAVIGAMFIGEWSEAAIVIFLFALAQLLESYSVERARESIQSLMELAPNVALVKTESGNKNVAVEEVNVDDIIIIKPGDRIPLDGVVISGSSRINQSPITGESMPVKKSINDELYAGTINEKGTLEVQVTRKSSDSTLARIIHLVEEAQAQKAPSQSFVEKFARYYTPAVVSFSVLLAVIPPLFFSGLFMDWFYRALVLLVISCPCALVISTPVTIVSGLTNAARNGILIKGGAYLENFGRLRVLAFDKTGTLTIGKPTVKSIILMNHQNETELLTIAASIESRSEHPLAQAIVNYAASQNISLRFVDNFEAITGKGVRASINDTTYFIGNHRLFEENDWCEQEIHQHLERFEQNQHTTVIVGNDKS
ncbi:MAG: cadmium-translocating P-type ATPase, partial [bacterium]